MSTESYNDKIVQKPWGYEYLIFENTEIALWALHISKNQSTSMHCHPNKTTGLIVLNGKCEVSFFSNSFIINDLEKIMIRKSLFHSTKSLSENGSIIFEIETPNNKQDLVRFSDAYGRKGLPYEGKEFEISKSDDCLFIDSNFNLNFSEYANCSLKIYNINDASFFNKFDDSVNFIILSGGIITDYGVSLANPGDIINNAIAKKIISVFNNIISNTKVLVVEKNIV
jgi:mannose-6-phosphate isomerase-like protein (cupin superfamily)